MASRGIVVGVNGSSASRIAVNWAAHRARQHGSSITVMLAVSAKVTPVVNRLMVFGVHELPHQRVARIIDDAVNIVGSGVGRGEPKVTTLVVTTDPLDTLIELSGDAELIVVGARRRSPWLAIHGSLGSALMSQSRCPVAIVRDSAPSMPHPGHAPTRVSMSGWTRPTA